MDKVARAAYKKKYDEARKAKFPKEMEKACKWCGKKEMTMVMTYGAVNSGYYCSDRCKQKCKEQAYGLRKKRQSTYMTAPPIEVEEIKKPTYEDKLRESRKLSADPTELSPRDMEYRIALKMHKGLLPWA